MKKFFGVILTSFILASPLIGMEEQTSTVVAQADPFVQEWIKGTGDVHDKFVKYISDTDKIDIYLMGDEDKNVANAIFVDLFVLGVIGCTGVIGVKGFSNLKKCISNYKAQNLGASDIFEVLVSTIGIVSGCLFFSYIDCKEMFHNLKETLPNVPQALRSYFKPYVTFDSKGFSQREKLIFEWKNIFNISIQPTGYDSPDMPSDEVTLFDKNGIAVFKKNKIFLELNFASTMACYKCLPEWPMYNYCQKGINSLIEHYLMKYGNGTMKAKLAQSK
jgi:hypothetical protein